MIKPPLLPDRAESSYDAALRRVLNLWFDKFTKLFDKVAGFWDGADNVVKTGAGVNEVLVGASAPPLNTAGWSTVMVSGESVGGLLRLHANGAALAQFAATATATYLDSTSGAPVYYRFGSGATLRAHMDNVGLKVGDAVPSVNNGKVITRNAIGQWGVITEGVDQSGTRYHVEFRDQAGTSLGAITTAAGTTALISYSDRRLKKDIVDSPSALPLLEQIRVVSHGWKAMAGTVEYSFIAQDLYELFPLAVRRGGTMSNPNDDGLGDTVPPNTRPWGLSREALVPVLVKAVQELSRRPIPAETQQRRVETNAQGVYQWVFDPPYEAGKLPILSVTIEAPDTSTWSYRLSNVTPEGCTITTMRHAALSLLGLQVLATSAPAKTFVHLIARKP